MFRFNYAAIRQALAELEHALARLETLEQSKIQHGLSLPPGTPILLAHEAVALVEAEGDLNHSLRSLKALIDPEIDIDTVPAYVNPSAGVAWMHDYIEKARARVRETHAAYEDDPTEKTRARWEAAIALCQQWEDLRDSIRERGYPQPPPVMPLDQIPF